MCQGKSTWPAVGVVIFTRGDVFSRLLLFLVPRATWARLGQWCYKLPCPLLYAAMKQGMPWLQWLLPSGFGVNLSSDQAHACLKASHRSIKIGWFSRECWKIFFDQWLQPIISIYRVGDKKVSWFPDQQSLLKGECLSLWCSILPVGGRREHSRLAEYNCYC